jgi:hypothetical protein
MTPYSPAPSEPTATCRANVGCVPPGLQVVAGPMVIVAMVSIVVIVSTSIRTMNVIVEAGSVISSVTVYVAGVMVIVETGPVTEPGGRSSYWGRSLREVNFRRFTYRYGSDCESRNR